jgi:uncharacterized protein (DUF111 family)
MEKPRSLLLVQIDHLSGEEIGALVEMLYDQEAANVQVIPTLTKKGRPGHIVLIDVTAAREADVAHSLARRFGISGYHVLKTIHRYQPVACQTRSLIVRCGSQSLTVDLPIKIVGDPAAPLSIRAEYNGLIELHRHLQQVFKVALSLPELRHCIEARLVDRKSLEMELEPESGEEKEHGRITRN